MENLMSQEFLNCFDYYAHFSEKHINSGDCLFFFPLFII